MFTTIATLGTPQDITLASLRVEHMFAVVENEQQTPGVEMLVDRRDDWPVRRFLQAQLRRDSPRHERGLGEPGQLVSKDRFLDEVWRGIPVTDEALTQCIRTLRKQLGDDAARPRFIETVPKHGYRFIAPVQRVEGEAAATAPPLVQAKGSPWHAFVTTAIAGTMGGGAAGASTITGAAGTGGGGRTTTAGGADSSAPTTVCSSSTNNKIRPSPAFTSASNP